MELPITVVLCAVCLRQLALHEYDASPTLPLGIVDSSQTGNRYYCSLHAPDPDESAHDPDRYRSDEQP